MLQADIKQMLIEKSIVVDNSYLEEYARIISINVSRKHTTGVTQRHHIVPKSYYNYHKIPVDNSLQNIVNLTIADHIRAHYLLALCCVDEFRYANEYAFLFMTNYHVKDVTDDFLVDLSEYEELYKDFCLRQSKLKLGSTPWNKGQKLSAEICDKLSNSHKGKIVSLETRERMKQSALGKNAGGCYVNNGVKAKHIKLEELEVYLDSGWLRGNISHKSSLRNTVTVYRDTAEKRISIDELGTYVSNGWTRGRNPNSVNHISKSKKGVSAWNKGTPLSDSHRAALSKNHADFSNYVNISRNGVKKRIDNSLLKQYEDEGWKRGWKN